MTRAREPPGGDPKRPVPLGWLVPVAIVGVFMSFGGIFVLLYPLVCGRSESTDCFMAVIIVQAVWLYAASALLALGLAVLATHRRPPGTDEERHRVARYRTWALEGLVDSTELERLEELVRRSQAEDELYYAFRSRRRAFSLASWFYVAFAIASMTGSIVAFALREIEGAAELGVMAMVFILGSAGFALASRVRARHWAGFEDQIGGRPTIDEEEKAIIAAAQVHRTGKAKAGPTYSKVR